jgi:hypothetical protein
LAAAQQRPDAEDDGFRRDDYTEVLEGQAVFRPTCPFVFGGREELISGRGMDPARHTLNEPSD